MKIKAALGWVLAFLRMGKVWEPPRSWKLLSAYTTFLPVPIYLSKVSLIIFWGMACRQVMAFGSESGYKDRDKGYFESPGQEVMIGVFVCMCVRVRVIIHPDSMTGKGPPAPGTKRISAGEGREGQEHSAPVCQPKGFRVVLGWENKELGSWWGREGWGPPCVPGTGVLGREERIPVTQRLLLPSPEVMAWGPGMG